jgi:hypothetical protein
MEFVRGIARFWYDFIVGDDWKIAAAVAIVLAAGAVAVLSGAADTALLAPVLGVALAAAFTVSLLVDTRGK